MVANKILTDSKCPKCNHDESKIWGHPNLHIERVCLKCSKIYILKWKIKTIKK